MPTDSILATKRIRRCFFFSLVFVIMVPVICIILAVTLHPREFEYRASSVDNGNRTIELHADLVSADLKQGTVVLDWSIVDDTCYLDDSGQSDCANINIYFATSKPSDNNRPTDPTFIWNITADINDAYQCVLSFRSVIDCIPASAIDLSLMSLNSYTAVVLCFAEDANTNGPVKLHLKDTSGLVGGLKIQANVLNFTELDSSVPELIFIEINLQRGTLIKWYCIVITITFWLITITICLLMIMTVGFGFRQRNEIVVVPIGTVFAFTQLRSTMPGAPDGFDFVGVLPCLVLLSICAITMVGIYIFTDPAKDSREQLTWSALGEPVLDDSLYRCSNRLSHSESSLLA
ncbi:hypothetical protein EV421DRAFT_2088060 [Armillaria borealis]|uniref:Uncharacterized protein n=1 Tax=Armillaria borealis TaxID=47425 RepID=A0AA39MHT0_9AGAR|nr:hypothetical protein EV421DRAFT_2088060 [Armillaria borealis]